MLSSIEGATVSEDEKIPIRKKIAALSADVGQSAQVSDEIDMYYSHLQCGAGGLPSVEDLNGLKDLYENRGLNDEASALGKRIQCIEAQDDCSEKDLLCAEDFFRNRFRVHPPTDQSSISVPTLGEVMDELNAGSFNDYWGLLEILPTQTAKAQMIRGGEYFCTSKIGNRDVLM